MVSPRPGGILEEFKGWLVELAGREASDLHLKVGVPPKIRELGVLAPIDGCRALAHDETEAIADAIVPEERKERFRHAG